MLSVISPIVIFPRSIAGRLKMVFLDLRCGREPLLGTEPPSRYAAWGCYPTQSTQDEELRTIFEDVDLVESDVFMDVGCGRGNVISFLLNHGFRGRILGVDVDKRVSEATAERFRSFGNVQIMHGNAVDFVDSQVNLYYLFNPFDQRVLTPFIEAIETRHSRATLIYFNPQFAALFDRDGWIVEHKKTFYGEARHSEVSCNYYLYNKDGCRHG